MRRIQITALVVFTFGAGTVLAHHGWSGYDSTKLQTLQGTIEESSYENPHGIANLQTADGVWRVVLAPASRMQNRGLTRDMLTPGTQVTVEGYAHRDEAGELRAERIRVGEKTIELR